ncbi:programmed cell death protein 4-like [Haliotis rubra]|uniref:programmed cell death protein 4-like n=1 Tax=Haliotis rubra TaxID=36100 RepID=UPI001EE501D3|nr:programmed cell death protein 4-like [Haliotis rubra]
MAAVSVPMHNGNIQHGESGADVIENGNELLNGSEVSEVPARIIRKAKRLIRRSPAKEIGAKEIVTVISGMLISVCLYQRTVGNREMAEVEANQRKEVLEERVCGEPQAQNCLRTVGFTTPMIPITIRDSQGDFIVEKIDPELTQREFEAVLEPVLLEYFEHGDTREVEEDLSDLNVRKYKPKIIETAVSMALDRKAQHREMTSQLISDLYSKLLTSTDISGGFDSVLSRLSDLTIDSPEAPVVVGQFIARAVADDCLPPKYITGYKGKVECPHTRSALNKADLLLSKKHGIVRLDNIWGTGGGRPVKYLVKQMVMLLKEYLASGDMDEATRCLRELDVPHFHHELVYEATLIVLEDSTDRTRDMMCELLKSFSEAMIVTPNQFIQGFRRVYDAMPDICLDVPNAYVLLEKLANKCHQEGMLSTLLLKELPQRGRKRFVSEGDGGRVKEITP